MNSNNLRLLAGAAAAVLASDAAMGVVTATGSATPNPVYPGGNLVLLVTVMPDSKPVSTGLSVYENLWPLGLNGAQLFDDGTNGDQIPGDNMYTLALKLPDNTQPGVYSIEFKVGDDQGRVARGIFPLAVGAPPCSADFNGDTDVGTDADIEAFFACLAGDCCATCGSMDFNGDGDAGTDADIESFFRVLSGGPC